MQINFTGHHVEVTDPIRNFATEKLSRLKRHFGRIMSIDVTFEIEKLEQVAKATIFAPGAKFHADSKSEDLYSAIDGLVDKLDRQLKHHKEKLHETQ